MASQVLQVSAMNSNVPFRSNMGAILLIGLDVKNGIILIEYIGQLRDQGMPLHEALLKAGRTRFRPILMTSLCTILGLVPLAMGFGPGADAAALGNCRHRGPDHQHAAHSTAHPGRIPGLEGPHGSSGGVARPIAPRKANGTFVLLVAEWVVWEMAVGHPRFPAARKRLAPTAGFRRCGPAPDGPRTRRARECSSLARGSP